ncbi:hypothetical protein BM526_15320 [Alteromonas mediterranea]|uniref:hypothetical protein n=1 Tax=Alteromonas mediterranea TaxID=314275 RepID=UPI000903A31D|nr:hypothetical protein [Alteromonas mediterranea]APE03097.1 hypothetical protein BM526_15320 [Alteromonas mediterranea]
MSLLSLKLFGHCADDGEDAIASDFTDENEMEICGVNEATGLPLISSGLKGCSGTIDVAGNPRGTDLSDFSEPSLLDDDYSVGNTLSCGMDIHSDTDWICDGSSMDNGFDDSGYYPLSKS